MLLQKVASLSALVIVLMSGGIAVAESPLEVTKPESPAVVEDLTQLPTAINSESETIDRNTNNNQSDSIDQNLPSNSAANVDKCSQQ